MALQQNLRKKFPILISFGCQSKLSHCYATTATGKKNNKTIAVKSLNAVGASLASKGFLRPHKPYSPPSNVSEKVHALCATLKIPNAGQYKFTNLEQKFQLLEACFKDFQHGVPNSNVHALQTVDDIIGFYETTVDTTVPYEALKKLDLPENLHIQYDYVRFHPDTDTKFGGKTAFPKSSTLVTGLKYRGKYSGHIAKQSWP